MKIERFDIQSGLYIFELDGMNTEFHSHPAVEILLAQSGDFALHTPSLYAENLTFAVIDSNLEHRILSNDSSIRLVMTEHHHSLTHQVLQTFGINARHSIITSLTEAHLWNEMPAITEKIVAEILSESQVYDEYDERINTIISYIHSHKLDYEAMIPTLKDIAHLSESRLSHLFKANVGISLKKYLVWHKLKTTINQSLEHDDDLFTSLIQSGFYDQPHFSKVFKTMLGIAPSKAYNSRTIQVFLGNE